MSRFSSSTDPVLTGDGLRVLENDHDLIRQIFSTLRSCTSLSEQVDLCRDMVREISMHASAEERYMYPLIPKYLPDGEMVCERNYLDDEINKQMMGFIESHIPDVIQGEDTHATKFWLSTVEKFIMVELEHMQQEERDVFPLLRNRMAREDLAKLETDLLWAKKNAPTHPHPSAPSKPGFGAQVLHPIVGVVDRVMDTFTGHGAPTTSSSTGISHVGGVSSSSGTSSSGIGRGEVVGETSHFKSDRPSSNFDDSGVARERVQDRAWQDQQRILYSDQQSHHPKWDESRSTSSQVGSDRSSNIGHSDTDTGMGRHHTRASWEVQPSQQRLQQQQQQQPHHTSLSQLDQPSSSTAGSQQQYYAGSSSGNDWNRQPSSSSSLTSSVYDPTSSTGTVRDNRDIGGTGGSLEREKYSHGGNLIASSGMSSGLGSTGSGSTLTSELGDTRFGHHNRNDTDFTASSGSSSDSAFSGGHRGGMMSTSGGGFGGAPSSAAFSATPGQYQTSSFRDKDSSMMGGTSAAGGVGGMTGMTGMTGYGSTGTTTGGMSMMPGVTRAGGIAGGTDGITGPVGTHTVNEDASQRFLQETVQYPRGGAGVGSSGLVGDNRENRRF